MNVSFHCPFCNRSVRSPFDREGVVVCPACERKISVRPDAVEEGRVRRCLVCPSEDLYLRKDFNQKLGLAILCAGLAASCVAWYFHEIYWTFGILAGTAVVDALLWLLMGNVLQCYRCQAEYRGVVGLGDKRPFDLEVHERHRQQLARLSDAQRERAETK